MSLGCADVGARPAGTPGYDRPALTDAVAASVFACLTS